MNQILQIENLKVDYQTSNAVVKAVKGVDLVVNSGVDVGIMGESGCGKSTIVLQILGLLKDNARAQGSIKFNNLEICNASEKELNKIRWREVAISFQNSLEVLNPVMKIKAQIEECIRVGAPDLSKPAAGKKINEILQMVQLETKFGEFYPHQLSGGMRQKVILAMALSCDPKVLILDEPTTALDVENKKQIIHLIKKLKEELDFTMIVISHDVEVISELSDFVYIMYDGYFIESGPTKDVLSDPNHTYSRGLLNASPALFKYKDLWGISSQLDRDFEYKEGSCPFIKRCPQASVKCYPVPMMKEIGNKRRVACHKGGIEILLTGKNLSKSYWQNKTEIRAVNNIDIEIKSGEILAILGKSGSGKSTLAQLLINLETKDSGEVSFYNHEVSQKQVTRILHGVQIVLQDPVSATNEHMTNYDVIAEPVRINKIFNESLLFEEVKRVLKLVQLPDQGDFMKRKCSELSGGQRQRLAIARALIMRPMLLIADEITSMLDPSTQANLLRELKEIQNKQGFSMALITHDLHMARKVSDRIFIMDSGRLIETATAATIFDYPKEDLSKKFFSNFNTNVLE